MRIKGIIFDYGGTIDTNSRHWASVLWECYRRAEVPVEEARFREAYVHGERSLALHPYVRPEHTFRDVLRLKVGLQTDWLVEHGLLERPAADGYAVRVAEMAYACVTATLEHTRPVVAEMAGRYPLVLVSNFYGNLRTVLADFGLDGCFKAVVESAVVGVRKPQPEIFRLGVEALGLDAASVLVVGDSYDKDILPAREAGCRTVWLKGEGWGGKTESDESLPDAVITDLGQLPGCVGLLNKNE